MQEANEGVLSKTRADVVCEKSLADVAKSLNLGDYLRLGKGEENGGGRHKRQLWRCCRGFNWCYDNRRRDMRELRE